MARKKFNVIEKFNLNDAARIMYLMMGCEVEIGYDFSKAKHPQEKLMWDLAVFNYKFFTEKPRREKDE